MCLEFIAHPAVPQTLLRWEVAASWYPRLAAALFAVLLAVLSSPMLMLAIANEVVAFIAHPDSQKEGGLGKWRPASICGSRPLRPFHDED